MKAIFIMLCAAWCIAVGICLFMVCNRQMREAFQYIYPFIAMVILNAAIGIVARIHDTNGG